MSLQAPIVPPDTLSKVCIIDEAWDVLSSSHSLGQIIRSGAKCLGSQPPVIITAIPTDYKCHAVDVIFQESTEKPMGTSTKEQV